MTTELIVLRASDPPSSGRAPVEIGSSPVELHDAGRIKVTFEAVGREGAPPIGTIMDQPRAEGHASTEDAERKGHPDVAPAVIKRSVTADQKTTASLRFRSLSLTWEALRHVTKEHGWTLEPHARQGCRDAAQWMGGFNFWIEPLIVRLTLSDGQNVIIADSGSTEFGRRSLGIFVPIARGSVSDSDIHAVRLIGDAHEGRWGATAASVKGFRKSPVPRHPKVWGEMDAYADLLHRRILTAVSASPTTGDAIAAE